MLGGRRWPGAQLEGQGAFTCRGHCRPCNTATLTTNTPPTQRQSRPTHLQHSETDTQHSYGEAQHSDGEAQHTQHSYASWPSAPAGRSHSTGSFTITSLNSLQVNIYIHYVLHSHIYKKLTLGIVSCIILRKYKM